MRMRDNAVIYNDWINDCNQHKSDCITPYSACAECLLFVCRRQLTNYTYESFHSLVSIFYNNVKTFQKILQWEYEQLGKCLKYLLSDSRSLKLKDIINQIGIRIMISIVRRRFFQID